MLIFPFALRASYWLVLLDWVWSVRGGCAEGWSLSTSEYCYKCLTYFHDIGSIISASEKCKAVGGGLATLRTPDDFTLAKDLLPQKTQSGDKYAYVGLNDILTEDNFRWLDGSNALGEQWNSGEPNNYDQKEDCAVLHESGLWDLNCCWPWVYYKVHSVLCECDQFGNISDIVFYKKCYGDNYKDTTIGSANITTAVACSSVETNEAVSTDTHLETTEALTTPDSLEPTETVLTLNSTGTIAATTYTSSVVNNTSKALSTETHLETTEAITTPDSSEPTETVSTLNSTGTIAATPSSAVNNTTTSVVSTDSPSTTKISNINTANINISNVSSIVPSNTFTIHALRTSFKPLLASRRCTMNKTNSEDRNRLTKAQMMIIKSTLSSYKRTKICASDIRVSSKVIGISGLAIMICFGFSVLCLDLKKLIEDFKRQGNV